MALQTVESILAKCKRTESGCLEWQGIRTKKEGYGIIMHAGQNWGGHRLMWHLSRGRLKDSKQFVLHKCDNPPCLDPEHMFLGTASDNAVDASQKGRSQGMTKTHCKHGHEYTPENTIQKKPRPGKSNGRRSCRACFNAYARTYQAKIKARAALNDEESK